MTQYRGLVQLLVAGKVEFILVGGVAGIAHGAARATYDLDVLYSRAADNLERIVTCLTPHAPYLRGAPPGLPFRFDVETLKRGMNFTLTTSLGDLDLLGEIAGGGNYDRLLTECVRRTIFGCDVRCLSLERLILTKRAAGRPKDMDAVAELEALWEEAKKKGKQP